MEIFQQPKDSSVINHEIDGLQKALTALLAEKEILLDDLKGYESDGYEYFKMHVLAKEKVRIALKRMTIHSSETSKHDSLQGQFNEIELLERNKEKIETDLLINKRIMSDYLKRVDKAKKRLRKLIERNK